MRPAAVVVATALVVLAGCSAGTSIAAGEFTLSSPAFADNTQIPAEYSCDAGNTSPPLRWQNVPTRAESLALMVDDPDAPRGRYVHWVVSGIAPSTAEIVRGRLPTGSAVSLNSHGQADYLGPCPPPGAGVHHYRFQLFALREPLTLAASTPAEEATTTIGNLTVAIASTVGLFRR